MAAARALSLWTVRRRYAAARLPIAAAARRSLPRRHCRPQRLVFQDAWWKDLRPVVGCRSHHGAQGGRGRRGGICAGSGAHLLQHAASEHHGRVFCRLDVWGQSQQRGVEDDRLPRRHRDVWRCHREISQQTIRRRTEVHPGLELRGRATMATKLKSADIVIVGLGWTGGILAKELAETGLSIVVLERGAPRDTNPDFMYPSVHDELRYAQRHELMQNVSRESQARQATCAARRSTAAMCSRDRGSVTIPIRR